jgi:RNA polymerase sigma-70 factor (ECF subfamily)
VATQRTDREGMTVQGVNLLDEAAFTELYKQHVDAVYRICYSFLKNRTDAEDAVQETFLRLMQTDKPLETEGHVRAWLIVTASNICKNMLHSWMRQKRQEVEDWETVLVEKTSTPEESTVLAALMQLPEKYKTVLYLYYYESYSCKEIASAMQKKETTVRSLLKRGREALQKKMGGDGYAAAGLEKSMGLSESR